MTSSHLAQIRAFADYNVRFNARLYDACGSLPPGEVEADRGAFFGSIFGTLSHILLADRVWLGRIAAAFPQLRSLDGAAVVQTIGSLRDRLYPDFGALRGGRQETDRVLTALAAELADGDLAATMRYATSSGAVREHPLWITLAHLFNHQTHHRGQVTTLLMQAGVDPGVTDFLVFATDPEF